MEESAWECTNGAQWVQCAQWTPHFLLRHGSGTFLSLITKKNPWLWMINDDVLEIEGASSVPLVDSYFKKISELFCNFVFESLMLK